MPTTFQVIALLSIDPDGTDTCDEPKLLYPDALKMARSLKAQGQAFRVHIDGDVTRDQTEAFRELGALLD